MKPLVRALALTAALGLTCLSMANGITASDCNYVCGTTIHQTIAGPSCCSQTFICPNGQRVRALGHLTSSGFVFCL
jgi:hypothetical protein